MTDKVVLGSIASFQNDTTAVTQYNANNTALTAALDNTLSRDGTLPNQMSANLDMNSNQIINLPTPTSNYSPLRTIDVSTINTGGITVSPLPTAGVVSQVLTKNSSTNFDVSWQYPIPIGGTLNQVLTKNSGTNFDISWQSLQAVQAINIGTSTVLGGGSNATHYGFLYNANGVVGDSASNVAQPLVIGSPNLPAGASALSINNSNFILPAFVNSERPMITLSGGQDIATQGETILFFDTFGGNANGTISMSKSGGGSVNVGSVTGTVLTVTSQSSGTIATGQLVIATGLPPATTIISFGTGVGGAGTYNLSNSGTVSGGSTIYTNDSPSTPTATQNGNILGIISSSGWYNSAPGVRTFGTANMQFTSAGNFTSSSWPTSIRFFTTPVGGSAELLRFTIGASGTLTQELDSIGSGQADGLILQNTTASILGTSQNSPSLHFIGQGFETNTSASQTVDWIINNNPQQGSANPSTQLFFSSQINGGGYISQARLTSGGILNVSSGFQIGGTATTGNVLRGNGTNFISAQLASTDLSDVTEAGSWTPSDQSGASLTFTNVSTNYTKIGNMVFVYGRFTFPSTANGSNISIGGLPFTTANQNYSSVPGVANSNGTIGLQVQPNKNATTFFVLNTVTGASITNATMSTITFNFNFSYTIV
jgi:hypothetical protein